MGLQQQIKEDLTAAMKARDEERKGALRVILGEFSRQATKDLSDDDVINILKKLLKSEMELLESSGAGNESEFSKIIQSYLPRMASDAEITDWIEQHVDFSQFKNRMQAMGVIMKHFGASADGNRVRKLLDTME